jgi:hypothetical protein
MKPAQDYLLRSGDVSFQGCSRSLNIKQAALAITVTLLLVAMSMAGCALLIDFVIQGD